MAEGGEEVGAGGCFPPPFRDLEFNWPCTLPGSTRSPGNTSQKKTNKVTQSGGEGRMGEGRKGGGLLEMNVTHFKFQYEPSGHLQPELSESNWLDWPRPH